MNNLKLIESGLIKIYKTDVGEYVVDGRELWQGLEVGTEFSHWIRKRLEECDAEENVHYSTTVKKNGRQKLNDYIIKLDTAKEMAMLERNDIGKQYRRYFICNKGQIYKLAINFRVVGATKKIINRTVEVVGDLSGCF